MRLLAYGPTAWLIEPEDGPDGVLAWADAIRARTKETGDVVDVVPAAATVLVTLGAGADRMAVADQLRALRPTARPRAESDEILELSVTYDGADLSAIADATGATVDEVIERHVAATYRCAFCGFAPGFAYLTGLDRSLFLPRRETPRTQVPAGSVAIAAEYTAVYPAASPGGWHLLGRTDARIWDLDRPSPALIEPGARVRFVAR